MHRNKILLSTAAIATTFFQIKAVLLDIHIPLPHGCLLTQALKANLLLQDASRAPPRKSVSSSSESREGVDLFTRHIPHITLYLADFDLEADPPSKSNDSTVVGTLNQTKLDSFLHTIDTLNFTSVNVSSCPLSFKAETPTTSTGAAFFSINNEQFFVMNGAYTMLPIQNNACLQLLSEALLQPLQPYLKRPPVVPSWVNSLPERERSHKISQVEQYGSPNVLGDFDPHVTVGYDILLRSSHRRLSTAECPPGQCRDLEGKCQPIVHCFADPCTEVPGVKCPDGRVCVPNFCGGCNFSCDTPSVQDSGEEQLQLRMDAMNQWNDQFQLISKECVGEVEEIAVGRTGLGGTVLSGSRMRHWKLIPDSDDGVADISSVGPMEDVFDSVQ
eukprot:CCRYP_009494-RA/>CCRYP_009494-RA protein AED:0.03 eAED:-0.00 QI:0/-1/0/1/-1/1/1/0/386